MNVATVESAILSEVELDDGTRLVEIEVSRLKIRSASYQRPLRPEWVAELAAEWDPRLCEPLTVSFSEGNYWVVAGQHRLAAMRERGVRTCYAVVHYGLTIHDEAALFSDLATKRRPLLAIEVFRAELVAGVPRSVRVKEALDRRGLRAAYGSGALPTNSVSAISALWEMDAEGRLEDVLATIVAAWRDGAGDTLPGALHNSILRAVSTFLRRFGLSPHYRHARLVEAMSRYKPEDLLRERRPGQPTRTVLSDVLRRWYNYRLGESHQV